VACMTQQPPDRAGVVEDQNAGSNQHHRGVPRLQRSGSWGLISQPSRAGLTFGGRPSGP
jgi:hypothetical protein